MAVKKVSTKNTQTKEKEKQKETPKPRIVHKNKSHQSGAD